jgi:type II secretory pathway pseudopilin PulG
MGTKAQAGFTIIETTLFLAITGLLILMMVGGAGASLNIQRYRDAVESFKSQLQQQYSDLANVQNARDNNWTCDSSSVATQNGPNDILRGQSNCFLIGKYMRIDGSDVSIYPVLASQKSSLATDDVSSMLQNYAMNVSKTDVIDSNLEWGTQIGWTTGVGGLDYNATSTPRTLGILFVRSPDSGLIYTFTSDSIPDKTSIGQPTFTNLLVAGQTVPGQKARAICVESSGLFVNGDKSVYIGPYAANANAVETRTNDINTQLRIKETGSASGAIQC